LQLNKEWSGCVGFIPMFVFGLRPSTIDSMSEGSLSQVSEMPAIGPTAQNRSAPIGAGSQVVLPISF
jgi:hypothetical protein